MRELYAVFDLLPLVIESLQMYNKDAGRFFNRESLFRVTFDPATIGAFILVIPNEIF